MHDTNNTRTIAASSGGGQHRRPGRPRLSKKHADRAKARILGVARNLFVEHGYEGVSIRKIAAHAGCSTGVIYNHFQGKREILQSIWDDIFLLSFRECHHAATQHKGLISRLGAFCRAYVHYWEKYPEHFRMIYLMDERESRDHQYAKHSFAYWKYEWVTQQIEQGIVSGELRPKNENVPALVIAESIFSLCQGLAYTAIFRDVFREDGIEGIQQQITDNAIDALLAGAFDA